MGKLANLLLHMKLAKTIYEALDIMMGDYIWELFSENDQFFTSESFVVTFITTCINTC